MSLDKNVLLDPASSRETRQVFASEKAISLGDFQYYLMAIIVELKRYRLFQVRPANTYPQRLRLTTDHSRKTAGLSRPLYSNYLGRLIAVLMFKATFSMLRGRTRYGVA